MIEACVKNQDVHLIGILEKCLTFQLSVYLQDIRFVDPYYVLNKVGPLAQSL